MVPLGSFGEWGVPSSRIVTWTLSPASSLKRELVASMASDESSQYFLLPASLSLIQTGSQIFASASDVKLQREAPVQRARKHAKKIVEPIKFGV
jgi:hypothetical protein